MFFMNKGGDVKNIKLKWKMYLLSSRVRLFILSVLLLLFFAVLFSDCLFQTRALGETAKIKETKDTVLQISGEEKENLEILFAINQKKEELQREEKKLTIEITKLNKEKKELEAEIEGINESYRTQKETLAKVLVAYERRGTASYLDALLSAGDLKTFIRAVNILRDLSGGVNELLADLEENERKLGQEQKELSNKLTELAENKKELELKLQKQQELKDQQEIFLKSLKEEKSHYEDQLKLLTDVWEGAKEYFREDFTRDFTNRLQAGNMTTADLNIHINMLKINGELGEEKLNELLAPLNFQFEKKRVILKISEWSLILTGTFEIKDDTSLELKINGGSFYDLPLEESSISDLFNGGYPVIDFSYFLKDMQFDMKIEGVESGDGVLRFTLKPIF